MLSRRLQVLLDEGRYRRLEQVARRRRVSVSTVVRDAIDRDLRSLDDVRRRDAGRRFLDGPEMEVPDVDVLAAASIGLSAEWLVSADRGFAAVTGRSHLDPGAPGSLERVGAA